MNKDLKKLPKEMQEAYKKAPNRPDENTPAAIMNFMSNDEKAFIDTYTNPFLINTIVSHIDENLLDLDLDETTGNDSIYSEFALVVTRKIMGLVDLDTNKSKDLDFYDNNPKIYKLKQKDFTKIGDLSQFSQSEKADAYAEFYGVLNDDSYKSLTEWEKRLFVDKVSSRQNTNVEKK